MVISMLKQTREGGPGRGANGEKTRLVSSALGRVALSAQADSTMSEFCPNISRMLIGGRLFHLTSRPTDAVAHKTYFRFCALRWHETPVSPVRCRKGECG